MHSIPLEVNGREYNHTYFRCWVMREFIFINSEIAAMHKMAECHSADRFADYGEVESL